MRQTPAIIVALAIVCTGCATVPKQAEELSATIGRDLASVERSHRRLAQVLFARMRGDVNRFVDEVYAPHQIRFAMDRQREIATSADEEARSASLLLAIDAAFDNSASPELQAQVVEGFGTFVRAIRGDIESMRQELLAPLDSQETEVLASIDRAYLQLHYANSIVTGHLASVVKVHETQDELLAAIGVDRDLRTEVSDALSAASAKITDLVQDATKADATLAEAEATAAKIKERLNGITRSKQ